MAQAARWKSQGAVKLNSASATETRQARLTAKEPPIIAANGDEIVQVLEVKRYGRAVRCLGRDGSARVTPDTSNNSNYGIPPPGPI